MAEGPGLDIERSESDGGCLLRLRGEINASFDPTALIHRTTGQVILDLDGVDRITSFGVRSWISAIKHMPASYLGFVRVRPSLVAQFNMVAGFGGRGELISLYLPYLCETCDEEIDHLQDLRLDAAAVLRGRLPQVLCPKCGAAAAFDDVPDSYLRYAIERPRPNPPLVAAGLIERGSISEALRLSKEVYDRLTVLSLWGQVKETTRLRRALDGLEGRVLVVGSELEPVDEAYSDRLEPLFELSANLELYFARMRTQVLASFSPSQRERIVGRMVSVLLRAFCSSCDSATLVEVGAAVATPYQSGVGVCSFCGRLARISASDTKLFSLNPYWCEHAPQDVIEYLNRRREEPDGTATATSGSPRFEVLRRLGTGGMAEVMLARARGPGGFTKKLAVKRILPELAANGTFVEMFLQEARTAARINHPNVVQIYDFGIDQDRFFISMEYVDGWDLKTILSVCRRLPAEMPIEVACRIACDLCAGLHAAHSCVDERGEPLGITHRDVSPHNVLLSREGNVKITDFGIAKAADSTVQTRTGAVKGKIAYMAPEQLDSQLGDVGPRSDLFAAGLVLYEMLTKVGPFRRNDDAATMTAVLACKIVSPSAHRPELPPALIDVLEKALERSPSKRYDSSHEFQAGLEKVLAGLGRPAGATTLVEWLNELQRRAEAAGELSAPMRTPPLPVASEPSNSDEDEALERLNLTGTATKALTPEAGSTEPTGRRQS